MKKIKALMVVLLISTFSYSQSFNRITRAVYLEYDGVNWNEKSSENPKDMFVILKDYEVTINNRSESKFITYGNSEKVIKEDYTMRTWKALDKDGKDCTFGMQILNKYKCTIFFINYNTYAFEYICDEQ